VNHDLLFVRPLGKKYNQENPMVNRINEPINAGINISLLFSKALLRAAYNSHICILTLKMRMKISVERIAFNFFKLAAF
jgi:hypothetical protein